MSYRVMKKSRFLERDFFLPGAPSMGALLWVKVPPRADHSERSEAQLHEGN